MCGAELSGSIMAATGVAAALPSTINPPSMNFGSFVVVRIVVTARWAPRKALHPPHCTVTHKLNH